jgi:hypothetical protein
MELEESSIEFKPIHDPRPHMPEPPPVRLVAVEDMHVPMAGGISSELDAFYVGLLKFEREPVEDDSIIYKAENQRLCFDILDPPIERDTIRPVGIEIIHWIEFQRTLIESETEFIHQRGLTPGQENPLLRDPAGNWVQVSQFSRY